MKPKSSGKVLTRVQKESKKVSTSAKRVRPENKSLYTRWDENQGTYVRRNFAELNGTPPPKKPERVRVNRDGKILIEIGHFWIERKTELIVVIQGFYSLNGLVFYTPYRLPSEHPRMVTEVMFRTNFIPWDIAP